MAVRALVLLGGAALALAQAPSGCIPLTGSTQCPGFSSQSINPSNLTADYPLFANVNDVTSFDAALAAYVAGPYRQLKYNTQLGCSNTTSAYTLQYATTVLCSVFTQRSFAAGCVDSSIVNRMACQSTCLKFATSENFLVADPSACGTTNLVGSARQSNLTYDFTTCTDWTTLISNNTATCVLGQNNEGSCGFGTNTAQLCSFCNPSLRGGYQVDSCCGASNANLASCGYTLLAAQIAPSPTPSSVASTAMMTGSTTAAAGGTGAGSGADGSGTGTNTVIGSSGLSKGAIAGIVIGSIVGALLLLALVLFFCARRRRNAGRTGSGGQALLGGGAAAGATSKSMDSEKGYPGVAASPSHRSKGSDAGSAGKGKKYGDLPPSPASTPGFSSSDSMRQPYLGSGQSSPTSSFGMSGPFTGLAGATAVGGIGAASAAAAASGSGTGAGKRDSEGNAVRPLSQDTMATGSSNERNLIPSVRDQYSNADIIPGSEVVAIYAYTPNLPDELTLEPDTIITVKKIYDDGWAVGMMHKPDGTSAEGAFPLVVCTVVGADSGDNASTGSSHGSSGAAYTAREGAQSSASHLPRSSASGRTSSIGGTSFESAQSGTGASSRRSGGGGGFFSGLRRR